MRIPTLNIFEVIQTSNKQVATTIKSPNVASERIPEKNEYDDSVGARNDTLSTIMVGVKIGIYCTRMPNHLGRFWKR